MADKNLHDIKIDDLDSSKKTPLKNILTLLALLFIILVISVVITKLILNTDEGASIENNDSKSELFTDITDINKSADSKDADNDAKNTQKDESTEVKVPAASSNIIERNLTSVIKTPLTSHEPKEMKTYSTPKKNNSSKEPKKSSKNTNNVVKKSSVLKQQASKAKKEYIDKVVAKKSTAKTTHSSSSKNASFLGGKQKDLTNSYYIKVGTYRDSSIVINKIKKKNFNYALVKVENDKSLTRVLVGPFISRNQAGTQLPKVKAHILSGAYITKTR